MASQLFEVPAPAVAPDGEVTLGTAARGSASEYEVIARLLRAGHKVAVPVVDDDGVDLIVNYRTKVQVKYTSGTWRGIPVLHAKRLTRAHPGEPYRWSGIAPHVDVVVVEIADIGWYVVPREVLATKRNVTFGPSMDQWREAWSVFDASR